MLAIRIGFEDTISEQIVLPMSSTDEEAVKKILAAGRAENQPVAILTLVSPVQPLADRITGMDYGEEQIRKELGFPGIAAAAYDKEGAGCFFRGA